MNILIGPALGEFGYELLQWQGAVRAFLTKNRNNYNKVIVGCRKGNEALYELATDFWYPEKVYLNTQAMACNGRTPRFPAEFIQANHPVTIKPPGELPLADQKFIRFGVKGKVKRYDILYHCRASNKFSTAKRNWDINKWKSLTMLLQKYSIACIGTLAEATCINGATDLRGIPLALLVDYIASAGVIVGPSSGAMHLASLCCKPHVVWCNKSIVPGGVTLRDRYERTWNPLGAKAIVIDKYGWQPTVESVYNAITNQIEGEN